MQLEKYTNTQLSPARRIRICIGNWKKRKSLKTVSLCFTVKSANMESRVESTSNKNRLISLSYAYTPPKILLETISSRTALLILILTLFVFVFGIAIDATEFHTENPLVSYPLDTPSCQSTSFNPPCQNSSVFIGKVDNLQNVISFQINAYVYNVTIVSDYVVSYNLGVYACGLGKHSAFHILEQEKAHIIFFKIT